MALKDISLRDLSQAWKLLWGGETYKVEPTTIPIFHLGRVLDDGTVVHNTNTKISTIGAAGANLTPFTAGGILHRITWNALGVGTTIAVVFTCYRDATTYTITLDASVAGDRIFDWEGTTVVLTPSVPPAAGDITCIGEW